MQGRLWSFQTSSRYSLTAPSILMSGDEMCLLSDIVNDYHDHVVAMCLRKLNNKVDTDDVPSIFWSLCRVELSIKSAVLQLSPVE
jgi:hypothetical protein